MKHIHQRAGLALLLLPLLVGPGCTTVVRENIVSSVNTGIGATIAENPQTQIYEIKAGYIRSQFYSIPTGKKVETAKSKGTNNVTDTLFTNDADITPEIVAGIRINSDIRHLLLGMEICESFTVGKTAVMSDAATAMYIANPKSDKAAIEASKAVDPLARERAKKMINSQDLAADEVVGKIYSTGDKPNQELLKKAIAGTALADQLESISKLNKSQFSKRLHGSWSDLAIEMKDNLNK